MSLLARAERFLAVDLWEPDTGRSGPARVGLRALRVAVAVGEELRHGDLALRATGLVYTTLLSLVPFLAVTFSVLKAFGAHQLLEPVLARALEPLGAGGAEVTRQVVAFVDHLRVGLLGAAGVAGLFYTVISLIGKVEDAFNHVWHVHRSRPFGRRFADYLSVVLVGPVLVFTALALIASARSARMMRWLDALGGPGGHLASAGGRLLPLLFLGIAFTFLYKFLPYTRVRLGAALTGGVTAAVLWKLAGDAFTAFVVQSPNYAAIYSGFAILILFLIWLDVAWLIVLVGALVAHLQQHPPVHPSRSVQAGLAPGARERLALDLLAEVSRRHLAGERPAAMAELAARLQTTPAALGGVVETLVHRAVLLRGTEPEGLALARAPEAIPLAEVLEAIHAGRRGEPEAAGPEAPGDDRTGAPAARVLRLRDEGVRRALAGLTARSLVEPQLPTAPRP